MAEDRLAWLHNWDDVKEGKLNYSLDSDIVFDKAANEAAMAKLKPKPVDLRFTQRNMTRACVVYFVDYHRCMNLKSDKSACELFKQLYKDSCPNGTIDKFNTWVAEGRFPGNLKY